MDNISFLQVIFGKDWETAHVTSFPDDPTNISADRRGKCWGGRHMGNVPLSPGNQYYTISLFYLLYGKAVRRKSQFRSMRVVIADDVREKLPIEQVKKLPPPSYKLLTSKNSEQWGWILTDPCTDRNQAENLLDGLVAQGLAPDGQDPGMRGVTRYGRLPEGVNSKSNRLIDGKPFNCELLEFNSCKKVDIGQLAQPFNIDLFADRKESRIDGAANVNHPLVDVVNVKNVRSDGRFDITCPWVDEHTNEQDDGTAVFTNKDLSIGFKCHHGHCQDRTGKDLVDWIEEDHPGWSKRLDYWKIYKSLGVNKNIEEINDVENIKNDNKLLVPIMTLKANGVQYEDFIRIGWTLELLVREGYVEDASKPIIKSPLENLLKTLRKNPPTEAKQHVYDILKLADTLAEYADKKKIHDQIKEFMNWSAKDLKEVIKEQRKIWYSSSKSVKNYLIDETLPKWNFPDIQELSGKLKATIENLQHLIHCYQISTTYNQITKQLLINILGLNNQDDGSATIALETVISLAARNDLPMSHVPNQLIAIGYDAPFNPVTDYIKNIQYDGLANIEAIASCIIVDSRTEWIRNKIFRMFMVGACAAADHAESTPREDALPKFEYVMTLVGNQGVEKTKFFRLMLPLKIRQYFKDGQFLDPSDKDSVLKNIRYWINELGELDSTFKKADIARLKAFLSESHDVLRQPYGRVIETYKRRTIFVGSVNEQEFLKDYTGNRRYLPLMIDKIRLPNNQHVINQAWAEAWMAYISGEQWWPDDTFEEVLENHRISFQSPITEESVDEAIKAMIQLKSGLFIHDILRIKDIRNGLKTAGLLGYEMQKIPSYNIIGRIMTQYKLGLLYRTSEGRYWVIRNFDKYRKFKPSEIELLYKTQ